MTLQPPSAREALAEAVAFHQAGNLGMARRLYRQVLQAQPGNSDVLRLLGTAEAQAGQVAAAIDFLTRSLSLDPDQAGVCQTLGILLDDMGRLNEALSFYERATVLKPDFVAAHFNCGGALLALGRAEDALARYDRVLALEPDYAEAHSNRGNALSQLQRPGDAIAAYERAIRLTPNYAEGHANLGLALFGLGRVDDARESYRRAVVLQPNLSSIRAELARLHEHCGDMHEAVREWERLAQLARQDADQAQLIQALNNGARVLMDHLRDDRAAEVLIRQSLALVPSQPGAAQDFINARQRQCAWPVIAPFGAVTREHLLAGIAPLAACALTDDPRFHLAINGRRNPPVQTGAQPAQPAPAKPLRIGYLSSDLRAHAVGFLMYEVPELHDRSRVEIYLYYCGPKADDPIHDHYLGQGDHFIDISALDAAAAAQRIADDGIQILVDINGHTGFNRKDVLARRPAPVIVNWLGFPGTMGGPHHHYILADDWIIPPEHEGYFSEEVMRLACYQPNNRQRVVSAQAPTRAAAGLPEKAFVFCCFNDTKKITRSTFEQWLAILRQVPQGVLWLLSGTEPARENLRAHAGAMGIDPARIVFADLQPNPQHLARYPLADLFLDTSPYGAHTTCSDALWMGVPVLTCSGQSFASRVGGSLVHSAGLPDLVCASAEAYVEQAVLLAGEPARLAGYRTHLKASRDTCTLFDTPALVQRLEDLYARMWEAALAGRLPTPGAGTVDLRFDVVE